MDCLFCKIVQKQEPADIIYEDDEVLGFKNIKPEAPVHLLLIPKKHLQWEDDFNKDDLITLTKILSIAKKMASEQKAAKFIFNIGRASHLNHIHLHFLSGWEQEVPMHNI